VGAAWRRAAVRLAYVAVVAVATLRGLHPEADVAMAQVRWWRAVHPALRPAAAVDALRNVALFAGFGAVWLASSGTRRLRRAVLRATAAGILLSAAVEAAQLFSPRRFASVLDVLANALGGWLGAAAVAAAIAALARARRLVPVAPAPLLAVALPYAAACAVEAFSPFGRLDQVPGAGGGPGARLAAALAYWRQAPWAPPPWSDLVLYAPAGLLLALWLVERGAPARRAARTAALAAVPVWAAAEVLRGLLGGDVRPLAVLARAAAAALGAALAARWVARDGRARVRVGLGRYGAWALAGLALAWGLRPFAPEAGAAAIAAKLAAVDLRPLASLFGPEDASGVYGVADVAAGFLLYAPLGAWLAGARGRVWPGLAVALAGEAAQLCVAGRTADVTDALVQAGGVLVGWAVVRRAERRRAERRDAPGAQSALGYVSGGSAASPAHAASSSSGTTARVRST
jgi:VanZ family protein